MVEMAASTVAMANPFFASIGLLQRLDVGTYIPSPDVIAFLAAFQWDPETAAHRLEIPFRQAWFGQALIPRIMYGSVSDDAAISTLAEASCAGPEHRKSLTFLLEFMEAAGIIDRAEGQVRLKEPAMAITAAAVPGLNAPPDDTPIRVQFHVNIQVDAKDLSSWTPEQIQALFRGIADLDVVRTENK